MDTDPLEKLFKSANVVKLEEIKKEAMRREVLQFMQKNSVRPVTRGWFVSNIFAVRKFQVALASFLVLMLAGGAVSVNADTALPGDLLYPVKIRFNEKMKEVLAFSDQAKLEVNIGLVKTRLQEAEQLSVRGRNNSKSEAEVNNNFEIRANKVSKYIDKLRANNQGKEAVKVSTTFEASLKAHKKILDGLEKNAPTKISGSLIKNIEKITAQIPQLNVDVNPDNISDVKKKDESSGKDEGSGRGEGRDADASVNVDLRGGADVKANQGINSKNSLK